MAQADGILRPKPRRTWQLTPMSTEPPSPRPTSTEPSTGALSVSTSSEPLSNTNNMSHSSNHSSTLSPDTDKDKDAAPPRTRSILNLTSSTLFGIYSGPSDDGSGVSSREDINGSVSGTPWGNGSMTPVIPITPISSSSRDALASSLRSLAEDRKPPALGPYATRKGTGTYYKHRPRQEVLWLGFLIGLRNVLVLFGLGVAYGAVVTRLHEETDVVPVKMEGLERHSGLYLVFWGCAGTAMGFLLPWLDSAWGKFTQEKGTRAGREGKEEQEQEDERTTDWMTVLRGMGAFVGIAFAIRRLPWESTLQASLTLALSNPVLWYLVDRSATGFILATVVGLTGTAAILGYNPGYVPTPAAAAAVAARGNIGNVTAANIAAVAAGSADVLGILLATAEGVAVSTWVASVLFYSCVCFGNIGRVLAFR